MITTVVRKHGESITSLSKEDATVIIMVKHPVILVTSMKVHEDGTPYILQYRDWNGHDVSFVEAKCGATLVQLLHEDVNGRFYRNPADERLTSRMDRGSIKLDEATLLLNLAISTVKADLNAIALKKGEI